MAFVFVACTLNAGCHSSSTKIVPPLAVPGLEKVHFLILSHGQFFFNLTDSYDATVGRLRPLLQADGWREYDSKRRSRVRFSKKLPDGGSFNLIALELEPGYTVVPKGDFPATGPGFGNLQFVNLYHDSAGLHPDPPKDLDVERQDSNLFGCRDIDRLRPPVRSLRRVGSILSVTTGRGLAVQASRDPNRLWEGVSDEHLEVIDDGQSP